MGGWLDQLRLKLSQSSIEVVVEVEVEVEFEIGNKICPFKCTIGPFSIRSQFGVHMQKIGEAFEK